MDKRFLEFRRKQLEAALEKINKNVADQEEILATAKTQKQLVEGQLFENKQLIRGHDQAPKAPMEVPVYESREKAEEALANRGQAPAGYTTEEVAVARKGMFSEEHRKAIENISQYNDHPEEAI